MHLTKPFKKHVQIFTALILITASLTLIFFSHQLIAALNPQALNGIETRFQLDTSKLSTALTSEQPLIVTALYRACAATCPANISILRQLQNHYPADIGYLFISLQPQQDSAESLQQYLKPFSPHLTIHRPADAKALQQLMNKLPEGFSATDDKGHHAGYIYLSHPHANGLIAYDNPTHQQIIDDLMTLQQRGK